MVSSVDVLLLQFNGFEHTGAVWQTVDMLSFFILESVHTISLMSNKISYFSTTANNESKLKLPDKHEDINFEDVEYVTKHTICKTQLLIR